MEDGRWRIEQHSWSGFYPLSSIFHPLSSILHPLSSILHPPSSVTTSPPRLPVANSGLNMPLAIFWTEVMMQ